MKKIINLILLSILPFILKGQSDLYTATNGNDNTGNKTIISPYSTIAKAVTVANSLISSNPNTAVNIWVRGGTYRNPGFSTTTPLSGYDPQNIGEAIWKTNSTSGFVVRLNNINGTSNT